MAVPTDAGRFNTLSVPPDSTGKKMGLQRIVEVTYSGPGSGAAPQIGDAITGPGNGFSGTVNTVVGTNASGVMAITADRYTIITDFGSTFPAAFSLNGSAYGNVIEQESIYLSPVVLSSGDNPFNTASIDKDGGLVVRYADGNQQLDAFGLSRVTHPKALAVYSFGHDSRDDKWFQETLGGGSSVTHLPDESATFVEAGSGGTDFASMTTHYHHGYQPGFGTTTLLSLSLSDAGKTDNVRRWGRFDSGDGVFFELDALSLGVVIRSSTSGSPVDTVVAQSAWNQDRLDGSGGVRNKTRINLDLTASNIYWFDFQWLGSGFVRFGIFGPNGARVTCHVFENANTSSPPWSKTPILPLKIESVNSGATAGPSRVKLVCASILIDGADANDITSAGTKAHVERISVAVPQASGEIGLVGLRPAATINSIVNRKSTVPTLISVLAQTEPVIIRLRKGLTSITAGSWAQADPRSGLDVNLSFSAIDTAGSTIVTALIIPANQTGNVQLPKVIVELLEAIRLEADGTQTLWAITAECLTAAGTTTATLTSEWLSAGI